MVRPKDISRFCLLLLALSVALGTSTSTRADDDAENDADEGEEVLFRATGERERSVAALHAQDPTAAGTVIDLGDRVATGEELRDVLPEVPAARVANSGADGQYSALGLRGAEFNHTAVLLDDVPLTGPETGSFDLSQLPLAAFERIEVYRGGAPTYFGVTPIGGVLRLLPARSGPDVVRASLGGESFGGYRAGVDARVSAGRFRLNGHAGIAGAKNDYLYFDDGNTPFNPDDDLERRRKNAQYQRGHAILSARYELPNTVIDATGLFIGFTRGEPGAGSRRTEHASTNLQHTFISLGVHHHGTLGKSGRRYQLRGVLASGFERRRFSDVFGELGILRVDADDRTRIAHARLAASLEATSFLELIATVGGRIDRFLPDDALATFEQPTGERDTVTMGFEPRLHGKLGRVPIEVRPSVRFEWTRGQTAGQYLADAAPRDIAFALPSYRLGVGAGIAEGVSLVASLYSGARNPTLLELFGNRARFLPNADLRPERSRGGDLGVVWTFRESIVSLDLEARAFALRIDDVIDVFLVSGQGQVKAINRDHATIFGGELGANLAVTRHFRAVISAHGLRTEHEEGLELPNRPRFVGFARLESASGALGARVSDLAAFVQVGYLGRTYYDPVNLVDFDPRTTVDLGARAELFVRGLSFFLTVRDVFDVRGMDFARNPLPGRRVSASIQYQKEL